MNIDEIHDAPDILMEFLEYHSTVRGHSDQTVAGYYLDLKILFRFLKRRRGLVAPSVPFNEIDISDVDLDFIKSIKIEELYRYQSFSPEMLGTNRSLSAASRCRRTSSVSHSLIISSRSVICSKPMFVKNLTCLKGSCLCRATSRNPNVSGFCLYAAARMGSATIAY